MAVALFLGATPAAAQDSLTVVILPAAVSIPLESNRAVNSGLLPIVVTTNWALSAGRDDVRLYAYFASASAALAHTTPGNTVDIPSSRVEVSINGGARLPLTNTVPFGAAGAGRQIFTQSIGLLNRIGLHVDTVGISINLAGYALPADTYTGLLRLRAQATP